MTGQEKNEAFQKELKELLSKYDAELTMEDFGIAYRRDYKIVVEFGYDQKLEPNGIVPEWVIGTWLGVQS